MFRREYEMIGKQKKDRKRSQDKIYMRRIYLHKHPQVNKIYESFELIGMHYIFMGMKTNTLSKEWKNEFLPEELEQEISTKFMNNNALFVDAVKNILLRYKKIYSFNIDIIKALLLEIKKNDELSVKEFKRILSEQEKKKFVTIRTAIEVLSKYEESNLISIDEQGEIILEIERNCSISACKIKNILSNYIEKIPKKVLKKINLELDCYEDLSIKIFKDILGKYKSKMSLTDEDLSEIVTQVNNNELSDIKKLKTSLLEVEDKSNLIDMIKDILSKKEEKNPMYEYIVKELVLDLEEKESITDIIRTEVSYLPEDNKETLEKRLIEMEEKYNLYINIINDFSAKIESEKTISKKEIEDVLIENNAEGLTKEIIEKITLEYNNLEFKSFYIYYKRNPKYVFRNRGIDIIYQAMMDDEELKIKELEYRICKRSLKRTGIAKSNIRAYEGTDLVVKEIIKYMNNNDFLKEFYFNKIHTMDIDRYLKFQQKLIEWYCDIFAFLGDKPELFGALDLEIINTILLRGE